MVVRHPLIMVTNQINVIGIAIILQLVKCPPQAKNVPLGQKRRRGRPCNAVLGLLRRARKSILTAGLSDNEEEFALEDTNMELIEDSSLGIQFQNVLQINTNTSIQPTPTLSEQLLIPDNISVITDNTFTANHIYDTLPMYHIYD